MLDERFEGMLRGYLAFLSPTDTLTEDTPLRDFGLDSMATVELISDLESAYQVRFVDDLLSLENFATPGTIWASLTALGATGQVTEARVGH
ncbi:acyl carrier protein [Micromonospora sp. NPDC050200]|uniref:acyl carrier protein n=1 Tax=Micromonospora sp. NPDC050200 TaxID=3155664 RepID=UPI0033DCCB50